MRINPIQNSTYKPQFGTSKREVYLPHSKNALTREMKHSNFTRFFREDLSWRLFGEYIIDRYKHANKVNIYCYGCSDGSEPYTLAMLLKTKLGNGADKFFPIIAKDYDDYIINSAKSGQIHITSSDKGIINTYTKGNFDKYFLETTPEMTATETLKSLVDFNVADITKDVMNIERKNSIVMCRNFWPYLPDNSVRCDLAMNLYDQLDRSSCLVLGDFDRFDSQNFLNGVGFKENPSFPKKVYLKR